MMVMDGFNIVLENQHVHLDWKTIHKLEDVFNCADNKQVVKWWGI